MDLVSIKMHTLSWFHHLAKDCNPIENTLQLFFLLEIECSKGLFLFFPCTPMHLIFHTITCLTLSRASMKNQDWNGLTPNSKSNSITVSSKKIKTLLNPWLIIKLCKIIQVKIKNPVFLGRGKSSFKIQVEKFYIVTVSLS